MQNPAAGHEVSRVKLRHIAGTFLGIGLASFNLAALGEAKGWVTDKRRWFADDEYMQGLGLAQLLPGATTVNLSSYLGFRLRGLPGAAVATVFFLIPCFLLMLLLSHLYLKYGEMPVVSGLFRGLGALVVGLVFNTILNLWKTGVKTVFNWLMAFAGFAMVFWFRMGIVNILLIAGGVSLLMVLLIRRFPPLARWAGDWSGLWKKGGFASGNLGADTARQSFIEAGPPAARQGEVRSSACSQVPLPLHWRKMTLLVVCLSLVLSADLLLIRLRPELMEMGTGFLRIGALVFGSGFAMLPFIQDTVVNQFAWLNNQQFAVALALSMITPGPVTIIGTFIGYKVAGSVGALAGMVNMYFPGWALATIVAAPYAKAGQVGYVKQVIGGIVAAFIGTLIVVLIKLGVDNLVDIPAMAIATAAFAVQRYVKIDTIWIVLGGALVSLVIFR